MDLQTSSLTRLPLRCWAEIDLEALDLNWRHIREALPPGLSFMSVVKAEAYGHGMGPVLERLLAIGLERFGVANVSEADAVKKTGGGSHILLMSPALPEEYPFLIESGFIATVSQTAEAQALSHLAGKIGKEARIHLKIDTGMGRVGAWYAQAPEFWKCVTSLPHLSVEGAYTHLASGPEDREFSAQQRSRFLQSLPADLPDTFCIHADNSGGIHSFQKNSRFNLVRVGLLQYGINPLPESAADRIPTVPALSFHTRLTQIKTLPAGTGVSYRSTYRTPQAQRIGLLAGGYEQGIPIALSNRGFVLIRGKRCPILGRVTMDQTVVSLDEVPEASPGDRATLIGQQEEACISLSEFSQWAESIPWEILTGISKRVPRIYRSPTL